MIEMHLNEKIFQILMAIIVFATPLMLIVYFYTKIHLHAAESKR